VMGRTRPFVVARESEAVPLIRRHVAILRAAIREQVRSTV
jgi:hypothetical protein